MCNRSVQSCPSFPFLVLCICGISLNGLGKDSRWLFYLPMSSGCRLGSFILNKGRWNQVWEMQQAQAHEQRQMVYDITSQVDSLNLDMPCSFQSHVGDSLSTKPSQVISSDLLKISQCTRRLSFPQHDLFLQGIQLGPYPYTKTLNTHQNTVFESKMFGS